MSEALLISNILLWLLTVVLAIVVAALTRQIGLLHERVAPVGALAIARGPEVGDPAPEFDLRDVRDQPLHLGGSDEQGRLTLLFFLSPTCPVCESLLPTLQRVANAQPRPVRIVYASDGSPQEHEALRREHALTEAEYVLSTELGLRYEVAKLPWAVLIDAEGRVRAKGLVNTREHVESLFEAEHLRVASLQDYMKREARGEQAKLAAARMGR